MDFLRNNKVEIAMLVPSRTACYVVSLIDLVLFTLPMLGVHGIELSASLQTSYYRNPFSICYIVLLSSSMALAVFLLIGANKKRIRNCQIYVIAWIPSILLYAILYFTFLGRFGSFSGYFGRTGASHPIFYIQLVLYPIFILVLKPLGLFVVKKFIGEMVREQIGRQDSGKSDGESRRENKMGGRRIGAGAGSPVQATGIRTLNSPSPLLSNPKVSPFGYGTTGRLQRDSEMYERVPGIEDLLHQIEFPMDNNVCSDQFTVDNEAMLKVEHDFFAKKGTLTLVSFRDGKNGAVREEKKVAVAVKIFRQNVDVDAVRRMLLETKILTTFRGHNNVIQLLGFCTENIHKGKMTLLLEYCPKGTLESFLRTNYNDFKDLLIKDKYYYSALAVPPPPPKRDDDNNEESTYENIMAPSISQHTNFSTLEGFKFTSKTLLTWALHIAQGMEYINGAKIIHGNLMSANCIVDNRYRIKIANFTFATQLYHYRSTNAPIDFHKIQLPWRWMPPECMNTDPPLESSFTEKSDVWSYGVTIWEIFSFASPPYEGLSTSEFFPKLLQGERLAKPGFANSEVYKLMKDCWSQNPEDRPTFTQLKHAISEILQRLVQS